MAIVFLLVFFAAEAQGQVCSVTASPVNFGGYDAGAAAPLTGTGDIIARCDSGIPFIVRLDAGANAGGIATRRRLRSPEGQELFYNLYRDAAYSEIWGDGMQNTVTRSGIGTGRDVLLPIYGRIPAHQNIPAGLYSDTLIITIEW